MAATPPASTPTPRRRRSGPQMWALLLLLVLGVAWLGYDVWRTRQQRTAIRQVIETTRAITLLEDGGDVANEELVEACELFERLGKELPRESLPARNLAIGRLLHLRRTEEPTEQDILLARQAQQRLLEVDHHPDAYWLAASILREADRSLDDPLELEAIDLLRRAIADDPSGIGEDARLRYLLYESCALQPDESLQTLGRESLREAVRLRRENVKALCELLRLEADYESDEVGPLLVTAKESLAPLRQSLQVLRGVDIVELTEKASQAVGAGEWGRGAVLIGELSNYVTSAWALKRDAIAMKPHPLELITYEYSERFQTRRPPPPPAPPGTPTEWVRTSAEQLPEGSERALAALPLDFDLDNQVDLALLVDDELRVFRRVDADWQLLASAPAPGGRLLLIGDLDNDFLVTYPDGAPFPKDRHAADVDLIVLGAQGATVFRNDWEPSSDSRSLTVIPQPGEPLAPVRAGVLVDLDQDSDLDMVLATDQGMAVLSGRGNGEFDLASSWCELPPADLKVRSLVAVDWDRDVDIDIVVSGEGGVFGVLDNVLHGVLRWQAHESWGDRLGPAESLAVLDEDGNASWDWLAAGPDGLRLALTSTNVAGVALRRAAAVDASPWQGVVTGDFDNDGQIDALTWDQQRVAIRRGLGLGRFGDERPAPFALRGVRSVTPIDLDTDGDLDLVMVGEEGLQVMVQPSAPAGHWLLVRAIGNADPDGLHVAGHTGLGSVVEIRNGDRYQARLVTSQLTHFGLGALTEADVLRVLWTNGIPQVRFKPQVDTTLAEVMTLKGSCPYLYTWDGGKFAFCTDLLWNAPLGLQLGRGRPAPARSWEYLSIPPGSLVARQGMYELRITEELWEAAYFDQVELIAVDHPDDVEVYSNEKVGPAELAEDRIHTSRRPVRPVAARDSQGADQLDALLVRDEHFAAPFGRPLRQGLTRRHFLELDFGDLRARRAADADASTTPRILLFLTGWILPANTSLHLGYEQHPDLAPPEPPSLWTPDESGAWQCRRPFLGFPGGKTKTIVVDVSDCFAAEDYRLRIETTCQLHWDEAYVTVDEPAVEVRRTPLEMIDAELRHRGFSERVPYREWRPETYRYDVLSTSARWPPMAGRFTRYGDVRPLLESTDDRLVVMGAGDELAVRFAVPETPLAEGWRRDFVLHSVGWDKDADLNTLAGQSSEPLPYQAMGEYPPVRELDTPQRRQDEREFQTRRQASGSYWRLLTHPLDESTRPALP